MAGVSDAQANEILSKGGKAKDAIMKRVDNLLEGVGAKDITDDNMATMLDGKDAVLKSAIEKQSKELIAQTGRVGSWSTDGQDMRGKEELHGKYTDKANKMDAPTFDANVTKALEYENDKDNRGSLASLGYNALWRKPMDLLNALRPESEFPKPWQTAVMGVVALAVLAPPAGLIACAF